MLSEWAVRGQVAFTVDKYQTMHTRWDNLSVNVCVVSYLHVVHAHQVPAVIQILLQVVVLQEQAHPVGTFYVSMNSQPRSDASPASYLTTRGDGQAAGAQAECSE